MKNDLAVWLLILLVVLAVVAVAVLLRRLFSGAASQTPGPEPPERF